MINLIYNAVLFAAIAGLAMSIAGIWQQIEEIYIFYQDKEEEHAD